MVNNAELTFKFSMKEHISITGRSTESIEVSEKTRSNRIPQLKTMVSQAIASECIPLRIFINHDFTRRAIATLLRFNCGVFLFGERNSLLILPEILYRGKDSGKYATMRFCTLAAFPSTRLQWSWAGTS